MSYKEHYLSEEHDKITCPLNRKYLCNGHCAWFDHEEQDCRIFESFWTMREGLNEINDNLKTIQKRIYHTLKTIRRTI